MIKRFIPILFLFALLLASPAAAQSVDTISMLAPTRPVLMPELQEATRQALEARPPSADAHFYQITYSQAITPITWMVSVAGYGENPDETYNIEDNLVWFGTLKITLGDALVATQNRVEYFYGWSVPIKVQPKTMNAGGGGGAEILLPFAQGTTAIYGTRAIHQAWGSESNAYAVDFVGGDDLGTGIMPPTVYTSAAGSPTYICEDDYSKAIFLYDETTNNKFIYLHLDLNTVLAYGVEYSAGQMIGNLAKGSIPHSAPCGWADQGLNHYHLHWGFVPNNGIFQAENWTLSFDTEKWNNGTVTVAPGQGLMRAGSYVPPCTGEDCESPDNGAPVVVKNFWDFIISALYYFANAAVSKLPNRAATGVALAMVAGIGVALRIIYVIGASMLDLSLIFVAVGIILVLEGIRTVFALIQMIVKMVKLITVIFG